MSHDRQQVRVRLAPSPTGDPHVGHAYVGLFDYAFARKTGGRFVLRIEDTDRSRLKPGSEEAILRALRWVGLQWDEGPDVGGPYGPYRQSERAQTYREHAELLLNKGAAYRCFCPPARLAELRRRQQAQKSSFVGYDGLCRCLSESEVQEKLRAGLPHTVRLKAPKEGETRFDDLVRGQIVIRNAEIDDQVLLKSDGLPTYHLAVVVDDHLMRISHVIRAEEWISSTPKHVLLYQAFGWELPTFIHLPLLRNPDRSKISKRKNPTSLDWYRQQGYLPEALLNFLALMGWSLGEEREIFSLDEMLNEFTWHRVKTSGPVFDLQKLDWLNGEYIRAMTPQELLTRILEGPYTRHTHEPAERLVRIAALVRERINKLSEFDERTAFFFQPEPYEPGELVPKRRDAAFVREVLASCEQILRRVGKWQAASLEEALRSLCEERGWKRGEVYMPLRVAVTCRRVSTPLFETMEILGRDECLRRIETARQKAHDL